LEIRNHDEKISSLKAEIIGIKAKSRVFVCAELYESNCNQQNKKIKRLELK